MEKRAVIDEAITPPEDKPSEHDKMIKRGKMVPTEVKIEELDENHPVRRLMKKLGEKPICRDEQPPNQGC